MSLIVQLKRKATREENNAAESSDCMIVTTGFTGNPLLTPVSGKVVKNYKSTTKNNKARPQTPTPNVGSPLNPTTPGTCRYDSSLGFVSS
uniref:Uncharacterized protein n=1 Tax=Triticum urartu TaxID=4572 RepID=A0A8R7PGC2_TRIUA